MNSDAGMDAYPNANCTSESTVITVCAYALLSYGMHGIFANTPTKKRDSFMKSLSRTRLPDISGVLRAPQ